MTIDEAIETLGNFSDWYDDVLDHDDIYATNLGIEALKLIQRERILGINPVEKVLPGETK